MSRERVEDIVALHQQMDDSYRRVCSKHGENYKYIEPHQFFGFVQQFVSEFQVGLRLTKNSEKGYIIRLLLSS